MGLTWREIDAKLTELDAKGACMVRAWSDDDEAPAHWGGSGCEFDIGYGKPRYQLSTGQIIEL